MRAFFACQEWKGSWIFALASFRIHVKLLLPRRSSRPGGIQEVAVEEHPSLPKRGAHGSFPIGVRAAAAPRVFGHICQVVTRRNKPCLDCPHSRAQGKSSTRERNAARGFWCVPYRTRITFYWRQQDQVTHKTNTKNPPISRVWGIFGFPLVFYTVVLKWKFLSKKIPLKGRKRQGIVVKILQNSWFNLAF